MITFSFHSGIHTLTAVQRIPVSVEQAWQFLSSPDNLRKITPPHMGFDITSGPPQKMYPGQIITYKVSPFPGIKTNWVTEITHVAEGEYFVDEQRFGPYRLWHHKHFIRAVEGGTEMTDIIDYKLPLGWLGNWMNLIIVKKKLVEIFSYRREVLRRIFGEG